MEFAGKGELYSLIVKNQKLPSIYYIMKINRNGSLKVFPLTDFRN